MCGNQNNSKVQRLAHVRWQEKSNTNVLQICNITGIEAFLITAQLRWTGHVLRITKGYLLQCIEGRYTFSRWTAKALQGHAEGQLETLQHCTSRARRAVTGSVRLAIALQDISPAV